MGALRDLLASSTPLLLFTVIGLGYFLGSLKLRGFGLGIAAVLFVGLAFGAMEPQAFALPEVIVVLGLVLFVYTVGVQSGPVFFNLFRRQGARITVLALAATGITAVSAWAAARLLSIDAPVSSGLFCGALTNTPALGAAVERLRGALAAAGLAPEDARRLLDGPTVGYSVAYPFGVAGLILAMQVATRILRVDFRRERRLSDEAAGLGSEDLLIRELRVTNPQIVGRTFEESTVNELTGMVFTRMKRGPEVELIAPGTRLAEGDVLVGVGSAEAVRKAELLVGPLVEVGLERLSSGISHRDLVVIHRRVAGMPAGRLSMEVGSPVIVSRIRRGSVAITPRPETALEVGDQIRVVGQTSDLDRVTKLVGDPLRDFSETDFLSFSLGLILGVVVGMLPIPVPGAEPLRLGFAGGPLVVGLLLGWLGRTGPIVWTMPPNANLTLRQLGIVLFLAGIGTRAGGSFVATFLDRGFALLAVGVALTALSAVVVLVLAHRWLGYDMVSTYGLLAGIHTQPAALAFANDHTGSENPNVSYVAVYPVALVAKIVLAQILVGW
jgi:putative transport protein